MSYEVEIKRTPLKSLGKIPKDRQKLILKRLELLKKYPKITGLGKLIYPLEGYRVRTGDYRILFTVDEKKKTIIVYKIDHRKDVYK